MCCTFISKLKPDYSMNSRINQLAHIEVQREGVARSNHGRALAGNSAYPQAPNTNVGATL